MIYGAGYFVIAAVVFGVAMALEYDGTIFWDDNMPGFFFASLFWPLALIAWVAFVLVVRLRGRV